MPMAPSLPAKSSRTAIPADPVASASWRCLTKKKGSKPSVNLTIPNSKARILVSTRHVQNLIVLKIASAVVVVVATAVAEVTIAAATEVTTGTGETKAGNIFQLGFHSW